MSEHLHISTTLLDLLGLIIVFNWIEAKEMNRESYFMVYREQRKGNRKSVFF